jgi:hypothetical protein
MTRQHREKDACREECRGEDGRHSGQQIRGATARHEAAATAANAERTALGALNKHQTDESQRDQQMNEKNNDCHEASPECGGDLQHSGANSQKLAFRDKISSAGGEFRLERDQEKWSPVFRPDRATRKESRVAKAPE